MAFRFRLASVLRLRKRVEDVHKLGLAAAARQRDAAARGRAALVRHTATCRDGLFLAGQAGSTGGTLRALADAVDESSRWTAVAADRLAVEESHVVEARADLTKAAQERRTIERLGEIGRALYDQQSRETEQRQLDDLASVYHRWRQTEEGP
jgi:flagellar export protein FliJ